MAKTHKNLPAPVQNLRRASHGMFIAATLALTGCDENKELRVNPARDDMFKIVKTDEQPAAPAPAPQENPQFVMASDRLSRVLDEGQSIPLAEANAFPALGCRKEGTVATQTWSDKGEAVVRCALPVEAVARKDWQTILPEKGRVPLVNLTGNAEAGCVKGEADQPSVSWDTKGEAFAQCAAMISTSPREKWQVVLPKEPVALKELGGRKRGGCVNGKDWPTLGFDDKKQQTASCLPPVPQVELKKPPQTKLKKPAALQK